MQHLLALRKSIDTVLINLSVLTTNQKTFDSGSFQPDNVNLPKSVVPTTISEASDYVHALQRQQEDTNVTTLLNTIGRARIILFLTQAQIELGLRQEHGDELESCITKDQDIFLTTFAKAATIRTDLARENKIPSGYEAYASQLLVDLQESMTQMDVPSQDFQEMSKEQLFSAVFELRLRFVESSVRAIELEGSKIQIAQHRIGMVVKMMESGLIPHSDLAWSAIEDDRKFARTLLASCREKIDHIENYMGALYESGDGVSSLSDFRIVRYKAAPLDLLGPNNP